jgi:hypothetical protein
MTCQQRDKAAWVGVPAPSTSCLPTCCPAHLRRCIHSCQGEGATSVTGSWEVQCSLSSGEKGSPQCHLVHYLNHSKATTPAQDTTALTLHALGSPASPRLHGLLCGYMLRHATSLYFISKLLVLPFVFSMALRWIYGNVQGAFRSTTF